MKKLCNAFEWLKLFLLFLIGGCIYFAIEIAYKGDSHFSMFITGGLAFVLIGGMGRYGQKPVPLLPRIVLGALIITLLEFICGCVVNIWLGLYVWDYSAMPFNLLGQICLPFTFIWLALTPAAIFLDRFFRRYMFGEEKQSLPLINKRAEIKAH